MSRNFLRAVCLALKQKYVFTGALLCSLLVGLCWGANIAAVYPFVEVIFRGESIHNWMADQIKDATRKTETLDAKLVELRKQRETADAQERRQLDQQIMQHEERLLAEQRGLYRARLAEPWVRQLLPSSPFETLVVIVLFLFTGTLLRNLFLAANNLLVERMSQRVGLELRNLCFRRTLGMEQQLLDTKHTGEWMSQLTANVNSVVDGVKVTCGTGIREPLKIIACLVGAALISWRLLFCSLLLIPLTAFFASRLSRVVKLANRQLARSNEQFYQRLAESLTLMQVVKAFTLEHRERSRFYAAAKKLYSQALHLTSLNCLARSSGDLLGIGVICMAVLMGGYLVLNQQTHLFGIQMTERPIGVGALMLFYAFLIGASEPARRLGDMGNSILRSLAVVDSIYLLIDQRPAISSPPQPLPLPVKPRLLTFERVTFGYVPGQPVLKDIDLQIHAGETLAIVGPSGSGKTTLANLMLRFYDPAEGVVRLEGIDLRDLRPRALRKQIGLVTQQPLLFDDTIRDNIRLAHLRATDADIVAAARQAHAHEFIEPLELGYLHQVGEKGSRLSGGQRQRIALARAILRDPAILILDEATNQIDGQSEQLIIAALKDYVRDRITVLITHRHSLLALADRILVLQDGRVVDVGSHEQLLARCSLYQRLNYSDLKRSA